VKRATASPVYEAPEDVVTPGSRMAASLHPSAPPTEPEEEEEEEVAPASQEGMSLRERLARAAAARHRVTSEEPEE
jgi:acyl-CoA synthetase (NDP forming)